MKYDDVVVLLRFCDSADRKTRLVLIRVAAGGNNYVHRKSSMPFYRIPDCIHRAEGRCLKKVEEVGLEQAHIHLAFRVPKTCIVLEYFRPTRCHYKTGKQEPLKPNAAFLERFESRGDHLAFNTCHDFGSHPRHRGNGAHAARIFSLVSVLCPFMILRRREKYVRGPSRESMDGYFWSVEVLFDDDFVSCVLVNAVNHDLLNGLLRLLY